jgi:hypothetical protein
MDLRTIANQLSNCINSNISVTLMASTGFTIGAGQRQQPTYADPVTGFAQVQALDNSELKQLDGISQQTTIRGIYLRGALHGIIRPEQLGGDLVMINGQSWLVVKILETWATWSKAAIVLQSS